MKWNIHLLIFLCYPCLLYAHVYMNEILKNEYLWFLPALGILSSYFDALFSLNMEGRCIVLLQFDIPMFIDILGSISFFWKEEEEEEQEKRRRKRKGRRGWRGGERGRGRAGGRGWGGKRNWRQGSSVGREEKRMEISCGRGKHFWTYQRPRTREDPGWIWGDSSWNS